MIALERPAVCRAHINIAAGRLQPEGNLRSAGSSRHAGSNVFR